MKCNYSYQSELEALDEFELGQEEFEGDSAEFEEPELEFEDGSRIVRIVHPPRVGDDSAFRKELGELEFEEELDQEVFPPDTRIPVPDSKLVPFRFICHISLGYKSADGTMASNHASGTLIGRRHVLTCGHAFDSATLEGKTFKVVLATVRPGRNSANKKKDEWVPFDAVKAKAVKVHPKWASGKDWEYDYALITLESEIGAKKFKSLRNAPLGCWGITANTSLTPLNPDTLKKTTVNMGGYPGDKCGKDPKGSNKCDADRDSTAQFVAWDEVIDPSPAAEPRVIYHKADLKKGQSGAPLWRYVKSTGMRYLVGVQSSETVSVAKDGTRTPLRNTAVRNTVEMMKSLKEWGWKA